MLWLDLRTICLHSGAGNKAFCSEDRNCSFFYWSLNWWNTVSTNLSILVYVDKNTGIPFSSSRSLKYCCLVYPESTNIIDNMRNNSHLRRLIIQKPTEYQLMLKQNSYQLKYLRHQMCLFIFQSFETYLNDITMYSQWTEFEALF